MHAAVGTSVGRADTVRKLLARQKSNSKLKLDTEKTDNGNQSSQWYNRNGSNTDHHRNTVLPQRLAVGGQSWKDNRRIDDQRSFGPSGQETDVDGQFSNVDNRPQSQPQSFPEERLRSFHYRNLSRKMLQQSSRTLLPIKQEASTRNLVAPSENDTAVETCPGAVVSTAHFTPAFPHAAASSSCKLLSENRVQSDLPVIPGTPDLLDAANRRTDPVGSAPPKARVRAALWQILEPDGGSLSKNRSGPLRTLVVAWTAVIFSLILLSISSFVAESLPAYCCGRMDGTWNAIEQFCVAVFTVEFIARFLVCPTVPRADGASTMAAVAYSKLHFLASFSNAIDLLAILPFYVLLICSAVAPGVVGRQLRVLKVLRVLRLLKVLKYFSADLRQIGSVFRRSISLLTTTYTLIFTVFLVIASIMYLIERGTWCDASNSYCGGSAADGPGWYGDLQSFAEIPDARRTSPSARVRSDFKSIFAALYWAVTTMTTTGYGDVVPRTMWGRLFGSIALFLGMNMIALPITIFSSMFEEAFLDEAEAENEEMDSEEGEDKNEAATAMNDDEDDERDQLAALAAAAAAFADVEQRPFTRARPSESSDWKASLQRHWQEHGSAEFIQESVLAHENHDAGLDNDTIERVATHKSWDGEGWGGERRNKTRLLSTGPEDLAVQGPGAGRTDMAGYCEDLEGGRATATAIRRLYEEHESALMLSLQDLMVQSTREIVRVVLEEQAAWQGDEAASAVAGYLKDDEVQLLPDSISGNVSSPLSLTAGLPVGDDETTLLDHLVAEITGAAEFPMEPENSKMLQKK